MARHTGMGAIIIQGAAVLVLHLDLRQGLFLLGQFHLHHRWFGGWLWFLELSATSVVVEVWLYCEGYVLTFNCCYLLGTLYDIALGIHTYIYIYM